MTSQDTQPHRLRCVGRDGVERTFVVTWDTDTEDGRRAWRFSVNCEPATDDRYEAAFTEHGETQVRVTILENRGRPEYTGMGITYALLPFVQRLLHRQVVSSSNRDPDSNEYRTCAAEGVWLHLARKGTAVFDEKQDRYMLTLRATDPIISDE